MALGVLARPAQATSCSNTNIGNGWTCTISVSAASANSANVTTGTITTSGNLGLIAIHAFVGGAVTPCTPTDTLNNTWTPLTQHVAMSNTASDQLFYSFNPTTGSDAFTCATAAATFPTITVAFFQTALTSPFDVQNGNAMDSTASLMTQSTGTLNAPNELLIASCTKQGFDTSSTTSFDSGFTTAENQAPVASDAVGGILAYLTQAGTGAINATCTIAATDNMAVSIATFKQAAAVVSTAPMLMLTGMGR